MPLHYNQKQVQYFKDMEDRENREKEVKQKYLEGIRTRAFDKKHVDVGQSRPLYGKPMAVDPNAQHGTKTVVEPGVAESKFEFQI